MKLNINYKYSFLILPLLMAQVSVLDSLKVPEGQMLRLKTHARGVQIYECKALPAQSNDFKWTLLGPEALLFDNQGKKIGKHYAGPTWEANDGSSVVGSVKASVKQNPNTIPWLLLQAKSNNGNGVFSKVTYIQRVNTVAGVAPSSGCDKDHTGTKVSVNYQADYLFYTSAD